MIDWLPIETPETLDQCHRIGEELLIRIKSNPTFYSIWLRMWDVYLLQEWKHFETTEVLNELNQKLNP